MRTELVVAWRSRLIPVVLAICALLAVANVANAAQAVRDDYTQLQHTRDEYAANHMDFEADLAKPAKVSGRGDTQSVTNLARYDYDTLAAAIAAVSPASSPPQVIAWFGFLIFPPVFFLCGLRFSTAARRHGVEKTVLVRKGTTRALLARQLALLVTAAITVGATLLVDVVARAIAAAQLRQSLPLQLFPPIGRTPEHSGALQLAVLLLVMVLFGGAGLTVGAFAGVFAAPAIVFLLWDFVLPILGPGDPRDWLQVLGHALFDYTSAFQLATPVPVPIPLAAVASIALAVVLTASGFVGMRVRNPLAS